MRARRVAAFTLAIGGLPLLLAAQVWLASRVERIDGFSRAELDGTVGTGEPLRLTWIGDSTGQGVGASTPDAALPRRVAARLGREVRLSVLAISGATTQDAIETQLPDLAATQPDWVIVGIGNNDVTHATSKRAFRERLDTLLTQVAAMRPEHLIVLGTAEFSGTPLLKEPLRTFAGVRSRVLDAVVRDLAAKHDALYVPIRTITGPLFKAAEGPTHAADDFHPNDVGYGFWTTAIIDTLRDAGLID
jgi:lysophospholipase L1-like esterase